MILRLVSIIMMAILFISCEEDETNKIAAAQNCLNEAGQSNAENCLSYIQGLTSKESFIIRCSEDFISAGITTSKLADAIINRDNQTTNQSSVLGMMAAFSFSNQADVEQAYSNCNKSGVESFVLFASLARISTNLVDIGGLLSTVANGEVPTQQEMETIVNNILSSNLDSSNAEAIGEAAVSIGAEYCNREGASETVCNDINTAVSNGESSESIGNALVERLGESR